MRGLCHASGTMSEIERNTAEALDLLLPSQIVAWVGGSLHMGDRIRNHPHPRKTNASGRANIADLCDMVLHRELIYGLSARNPKKAQQVVRELGWSSNPELVSMSKILAERLTTAEK
jgi:hypothetical protein